MNTTQQSAVPAVTPSVHLSDRIGYQFFGDQVALSADVSGSCEEAFQLQLWACQQPCEGENLNGTVVAEVDLLPQQPLQYVQQKTFAQCPAGQQEHAMVMALVRHDSEGNLELHDYVNFEQKQQFCHPRMLGKVEAKITDNQANIRVDGIINPRDKSNISGSISLELWATQEPYKGGAVQGHWLAGVELGQLRGGQTRPDNQFELEMKSPPEGGWSVVAMLREWTSNGYITRDYQVLPPRLKPAVSKPIVVPIKEVVAPVETVAPTSVTPKPAESDEDDKAVSVNTASFNELAKVKGISKQVAKEIVERRPHVNLDDLIKIRGIGKKTMTKLLALLKL